MVATIDFVRIGGEAAVIAAYATALSAVVGVFVSIKNMFKINEVHIVMNGRYTALQEKLKQVEAKLEHEIIERTKAEAAVVAFNSPVNASVMAAATAAAAIVVKDAAVTAADVIKEAAIRIKETKD